MGNDIGDGGIVSEAGLWRSPCLNDVVTTHLSFCLTRIVVLVLASDAAEVPSDVCSSHDEKVASATMIDLDVFLGLAAPVGLVDVQLRGLEMRR